jgi:hypothetical protein
MPNVHQCDCLENRIERDRIVARAVEDATSAFVGQPRALSVLRNGGPETHFRDVLLASCELQDNERIIGFSEATANGVSRIDLLCKCLHCSGALFAIELKSNFSNQTDQFPINLTKVCAQLRRLAKLTKAIDTFLVYMVTDVWHDEPMGALVAAHNTQMRGSGSRKRNYKTIRNTRPEAAAPPFQPQPTAQGDVPARDTPCVAGRLRVWAARYYKDSDDLYLLQYVNGAGEAAGNPVPAVG